MINNKIFRIFAHVAGTVTTLSLAYFALSPQAKALDPLLFTSTSSFTGQTTELNGGPVLTGTLYNAPANVDVTQVTVTISGTLNTNGTVKNTASQAQSFKAFAIVEFFALAPDINTPAALAAYGNDSFTADDGTSIDSAIDIVKDDSTLPKEQYTNLGSEATASYGPASLTDTGNTAGFTTESFTAASDISEFLGTGTFNLLPYTTIDQTFNGVGGNVSVDLTTLANASLTIQYYGHVVVPWNYDSASFSGMLVLGFGTCAAIRKIKSNLHV
jgi:hypothetical protein